MNEKIHNALKPFLEAFEKYGHQRYVEADAHLKEIHDKNLCVPSGLTLGDFRRLYEAVKEPTGNTCKWTPVGDEDYVTECGEGVFAWEQNNNGEVDICCNCNKPIEIIEPAGNQKKDDGKEYEIEAETPIDDLLLQEIYSLREKLKISIAAIKSYDPDFDDVLFTHRINSVDFDQLMEELNGEQKEKATDSRDALDFAMKIMAYTASNKYTYGSLADELVSFAKAYQAIKCAECRKNAWIPIADFHKVDGKKVYATDRINVGVVTMKRYNEGEWGFIGSLPSATHFMDIPELPKAPAEPESFDRNEVKKKLIDLISKNSTGSPLVSEKEFAEIIEKSIGLSGGWDKLFEALEAGIKMGYAVETQLQLAAQKLQNGGF